MYVYGAIGIIYILIRITSYVSSMYRNTENVKHSTEIWIKIGR